MAIALIVAHSIICVLLIVSVLLHSGKDAGLSGAFGVSGGSSSGGSSQIVEKNLDRITVVIAVLFFATTFALSRVL